MATTVTDPLIGRLIDGRYEVVSRIARGGMATVYLARDRRLEREVALKLMHPHLAEGTDVAARFRREARAAARLAHPGVVQVFDQGSEGETSYLTMEYVEGTNLRRLLSRAGALSVGTTLDVTIAILDALAAAHRAGFVHRDIKPENVLVARSDGGIGGIKVADFGLARAATEATAASTGTLLGTVAYLAPEIITDGSADARADVYAVGVLCYELLTGRQPYEGDTAIQVAYQHVHENLPAPSALVPELPSEVDEFIAALTSREMADRPADAGAALDLALELRRRLDERSLAVRADVPGSADETIADATVSFRGGDPDEEGGGTISLPIGAVSSAESAEPGDTTRLARRRRRRWPVLVLVLALLAAVGAGLWWYFEHGPGAYTNVPDVAGMAAGDAAAAIEDARLTSERASAHSDEIPAGHVIETDPGVGERIRYDGAVTLVVSEGVRMIDMPDLTGLDADGIAAALSDAGWDGESDAVSYSEEWSDDVPKGEYLSGGPEPGAPLRHDASLELTLSGGREPVTIISVEGASAEEAKKDLEAKGLVYAESEERAFSDEVPEGHVVSQDPEAGTDGHKGDEVTVVLSKGPELFEVPNVFGKRFDDAEQILVDAGFDVERVDALGGVFGLVQSQSVGAGEMHPKGTVIVLTVV